MITTFLMLHNKLFVGSVMLIFSKSFVCCIGRMAHCVGVYVGTCLFV